MTEFCVCLWERGGGGGKGRVWEKAALPSSSNFASRFGGLLAVPRRLFCFGSLVILDVARCYLWLFTLYINIKIGKNSC